MQAKIGELEASLATVTGALQQLSTQQAVHSAPKPPKPPMPEKYEGDRRSGAASNWLHQMTLYLTILGLLDTAHAIPQAVSFLIGLVPDAVLSSFAVPTALVVGSFRQNGLCSYQPA